MDNGTSLISPSSETPQDQATAPPPGSQQQPTSVRGPFSQYLDPTQTVQPAYTSTAGRPNTGMHPAGRIGYFADQLLSGIAKGRAMAYNKSLQQTAATYKQLDTAAQDIKDSGLPEAEQTKLLNRLKAARMGFVAGAIDPDSVESVDGKKQSKTKKKDENKNPIVEFLHKSALALAGPGAQPQQITPTAVHKVLGEVYSTMLNTKGQQEQLRAAQTEYMAAASDAIKEAGDGKEISLTDLWGNERFRNAASKVAGLSKDMKIPVDLDKPVQDLIKIRSAKPWDAEREDGSTFPVVVSSDGVARDPKTGDMVPPGSYKRLLPGGYKAPQPKAETEADKERTELKDWIHGVTGSDVDKDPELKTAAAELRKNDNLRVLTQANLHRQKADKNGHKDFNAAYYKAVDELKSGKDNQVALEALRVMEAQFKVKEDEKKAKTYNPATAKQMVRKILNGVHDEGASTVIGDLRKTALEGKTYQERATASQKLKDFAKENAIKFYGFPPEKLEQITDGIDATEWDKVVGGKPDKSTLLVDPRDKGGTKVGTKTQDQSHPASAAVQTATPPGGEAAPTVPPAPTSQPQTATVGNITVPLTEAVKGSDGKWRVVTGTNASGTKFEWRPATAQEIKAAQATAQ